MTELKSEINQLREENSSISSKLQQEKEREIQMSKEIMHLSLKIQESSDKF